MAYAGGTTGHYTIAAGAALNVPSGDFSWGCRFYYSSAADNDNLFDNYSNTPTEGYRIWITGDGYIRASLDLSTTYQGTAGTTGTITTGHYVLVAHRDNSASTLYIKAAKFGGTALHASDSKTSLSSGNKGTWTVPGTTMIGADKDLDSGQYFINGNMSEAFKIDGAISDESIIALGNGAPLDQIPESNNLVGWWDFRTAETTIYNKAGSSCTATKQNSLSTGEHYPISGARIIQFPKVEAAGGGGPTVNGISSYTSINGITNFTSVNGQT